MKFCFICGKNTRKLIEGYCEDCYNKNFNLIEIPKELKITKCSKCGKIRQKNKWITAELENLIKNNIKILGKNVKAKLDENKIIVSGSLIPKTTKEEVHEININVIKTLCNECSKKTGGYYEAIIQLRGNINEGILNLIDNEARNTFYKIKNVKNGFDLYIGNEHIANRIAEILKRNYKFKVKKSFKLHTKKEGKDIYKTTILINCD
jgi:nonsense-mediated mRNA decay protein 3